MANTLTDLIPDVYSALDVVSRELVGFIPAVTRDPATERAAVNQTVRSFVAPASTAGNITPGVTPPDDGDQVIGNIDLTMTKARRVPIRWNGEQTRGVNNGGAGARAILQAQIQQAIRTLTNEMESDLAALHVTTSRAYGTAGTTPFGTAGDYTDASNVRKILVDNGAPTSDMHLIINTAAGANLRGKQGGKANEAGTDIILRQGVLLDIHGMAIRESAQVATAGTNVITGTVTVTGVNAVGTTSIGVTTAAGAAVSAVAGDIITIAGDANKYVIAAAVTIGASTTGTIVIAAPGLQKATTAALAISGVAAAGRNMAFARSALILATRAPALPEGGDSAIDRTMITDPISGISFELSMYAQYRQMQYELAVVWGVKNVKPEHSALLLG